MHMLQRSASDSNRSIKQKPYRPIIKLENASSPAQRTASLDTFYIARRTRYPSDPKQEPPNANPTDLSVAKALLNVSTANPLENCEARQRTVTGSTSTQQSDLDMTLLSGYPSTDLLTPHLQSQCTSRYSSTASKSSIGLLSSGSVANTDAKAYASWYNNLAPRYGLSGFDLEGRKHFNCSLPTQNSLTYEQ